MLKPLFAVLVLVAAGLPNAVADPWFDDFSAARKAAVTTGKPILAVITGSDWSIPSQRLQTEVLDRPGFLDEVPEKYVLFRMDYPRKYTQPEKIRAQNEALEAKYPFDGFPTVLLFDAQGFLYGKHTGLVPGGVAAFLELLSSMEPRKAALTALSEAVKKAAPGADRAQAQDALFRQAEAWDLESQYGDLPLKIVQEDKDGSAGLKVRYQVFNAYNRFLATWTDLPDYRQAVQTLEQLAVRAQPWPDLGQRILFTLGMVQLNALDDELKAKDAFHRAKALGKETALGLRAQEFLDNLP